MEKLPHFVFFVFFLMFSVVSGQAGVNVDSNLSPQLIGKIRSAYEMDSHTRSMMNSVTNNDIKSLALNRDIVQNHNELYSHKIKTKGITNQKKSGRCWLFAGLNVLRPEVIKKYKLEGFELSQNYLAFWDKLEKANTLLEYIIEFRDRDVMDRDMELILRNPVSDGGYWENVVNLIEKYGVVPKNVMPETKSSEETDLMNSLMSRKLRADAIKLRQMYKSGGGVEEMRLEKQKMLGEVYKMLVINLGSPPNEFVWRYEDVNSVVSAAKKYSPQSFYRDFIGVDLRDYVNLVNDPSKEPGRHYEVRATKSLYDGENLHFANVDIKVLKDAARKMIDANEPVWFGCDVGQDQDKEHGIMQVNMYDYNSIYGIEMKISKGDRSLYRECSPTHAMVFTGIDDVNGRLVKWRVENSWGDDKGSKGYWALYDEWFDEYVFDVIVKKKYVSDEVLKIFEQKPVVLPPWDPMFTLGKK